MATKISILDDGACTDVFFFRVPMYFGPPNYHFGACRQIVLYAVSPAYPLVSFFTIIVLDNRFHHVGQVT